MELKGDTEHSHSAIHCNNAIPMTMTKSENESRI